MKLRIVFLAVILTVIVAAEGRRFEIPPGSLSPEARGGGGGSSCIIRKRSIDVDDDDDTDDEKSKQASIGNGSIFIPSADDPYDDEYEDDEEDDEESDEYDEPSPYPFRPFGGGGFGPYGGGGFGGYGGGFGGMRPNADTSLSVSSEPNFGPFGPYAAYHSGDKYKSKKKKKNKDKDKKGGNINCIIITKGKVTKQKPPKLFGFLPLTSRRRRSLSRQIRLMKSSQ